MRKFRCHITENPVHVLDDQEYTVETCAAVCELLEWCTHIFVGHDSTHMGVTTANTVASQSAMVAPRAVTTAGHIIE